MAAPYYAPPLGATVPETPAYLLGSRSFAPKSPFAQDDVNPTGFSSLGLPEAKAPAFGPAVPSGSAATAKATGPAVPATDASTERAGYGVAAQAASMGLNSIQPASASYDVESGVANTASSALTGAISGAIAGSAIPGIGTAVGAVAGATVGLVAGAVNAWMGVGAARKQRRDQQKLIAEANARRQQELDQARNDAIGQETYNRAEARKANIYSLYQDRMKNLWGMVDKSDELKSAWVKNGWVR